MARRVCQSSRGVGRCRLVSFFTGEGWRKAKGVGLARKRAKRRSEKENQKGGNPPLAGHHSGSIIQGEDHLGFLVGLLDLAVQHEQAIRRDALGIHQVLLCCYDRVAGPAESLSK